MRGLSCVAAFDFAWIYVLVPFRQLARPWRVISSDKQADRIWHVEIEPDGHDGMDCTAGQFAWLDLGESLFSIASAPALDVVYFFGSPPDDWAGGTGRIDAALLSRHFPREALDDWVFILCGPPPCWTPSRKR